jgi:hypothetical protein
MYALLYTLSALGRRKGLNLRILLPAAARSGAFISVFSLLYAMGNCFHVTKSGNLFHSVAHFVCSTNVYYWL